MFVLQSFAKQSPKFLAQLDKAKVDPTGVFVNDTLNNIFLGGRKFPVYTDPQEQVKKEQKSGSCVLL